MKLDFYLTPHKNIITGLKILVNNEEKKIPSREYNIQEVLEIYCTAQQVVNNTELYTQSVQRG